MEISTALQTDKLEQQNVCKEHCIYVLASNHGQRQGVVTFNIEHNNITIMISMMFDATSTNHLIRLIWVVSHDYSFFVLYDWPSTSLILSSSSFAVGHLMSM